MIYMSSTRKLYEMRPAQLLLAEAINELRVSFKVFLVGTW